MAAPEKDLSPHAVTPEVPVLVKTTTSEPNAKTASLVTITTQGVSSVHATHVVQSMKFVT